MLSVCGHPAPYWRTPSLRVLSESQYGGFAPAPSLNPGNPYMGYQARAADR